MKRQHLVVGTLVVLVVFVGCATISGGTSEVLDLKSSPSSAKVTINGREYTTPTSIEVPRGEKLKIVVEKAGYKPATVHLDRKFRGWATIGGNVLWLLPGVVVDGMTGSWWELKEKSIHVILEPLESASQEAKEQYQKAIEEEKRRKAEEEKRD